MDKFQVDPENDIANEPYKGPGPIVASAGYVSLSHLASTIVGFVAIGALGSLVAKQTVAVKEAFTNFSAHHVENSSGIKKLGGQIVGLIPKIADKIAHEVVGIGKKLGGNKLSSDHIAEDKLSAFMFAGGIGGAAGWVGSTIWGIAKGGHEGNVGKRQFNRAKAEIKELRERNDDLEKINDDLHAKYVEASTRLESADTAHATAADKIVASSADTAPADETAPSHSASTMDNASTSSHHENTIETPSASIQSDESHASEHHGKIHAHTPHVAAEHAPA